jgi:hypothetical protein
VALRRPLVLGPLTRLISDGAKWRHQGAFPECQGCADDLERVLNFSELQGQFERFLPRLKDDARSRDSALAEIRTGFLFHRKGFKILRWEPPSGSGKLGDLEIRWGSTEAIFVEVKAPDWEGELSESERTPDRKALGRLVDGEARSVDPIGEAFKVIEENALPKFSDTMPNLVVVVDNYFSSVVGHPYQYLQERAEAELRAPKYSRLGGVLFLKTDVWKSTVEYLVAFVANPNAIRNCSLPTGVIEGLARSSRNDERRITQRPRGVI